MLCSMCSSYCWATQKPFAFSSNDILSDSFYFCLVSSFLVQGVHVCVGCHSLLLYFVSLAFEIVYVMPKKCQSHEKEKQLQQFVCIQVLQLMASFFVKYLRVLIFHVKFSTKVDTWVVFASEMNIKKKKERIVLYTQFNITRSNSKSEKVTNLIRERLSFYSFWLTKFWVYKIDHHFITSQNKHFPIGSSISREMHFTY